MLGAACMALEVAGLALRWPVAHVCPTPIGNLEDVTCGCSGRCARPT